MIRTVLFPSDRRFRYRLGRRWGERAALAFVLLEHGGRGARGRHCQACIGFGQRLGYRASKW